MDLKKSLRTPGLFLLKIFFPKLYYIESNGTSVGILNKNIARSNVSLKASISGPCQIGNCEIGDYTYISSNSVISLTKIGKFCSVGPNLMCGFGIHPTNGLSTSPAFYSTHGQCGIIFSKTNKIQENLPITIGNDVFIGMNVTILDGVSIGDGAIIGAGAVVSKDIPAYAIAFGAPIKITKYRFSEERINELLKIKWWDFDIDALSDVEKYFFDADAFIAKYKKNDIVI